ncbi:hypothetical protein PsAD14_03861 [Pseudovibrio sp. Ad14]|nr:hypothetical protein PsW74_02901 [Pseudovibrio sp. W74]KZL07475.1 hypothetical protein PsAD14_03861 [Pseudovibrio sp. Ad14]
MIDPTHLVSMGGMETFAAMQLDWPPKVRS